MRPRARVTAARPKCGCRRRRSRGRRRSPRRCSPAGGDSYAPTAAGTHPGAQPRLAGAAAVRGQGAHGALDELDRTVQRVEARSHDGQAPMLRIELRYWVFDPAHRRRRCAAPPSRSAASPVELEAKAAMPCNFEHRRRLHARVCAEILEDLRADPVVRSTCGATCTARHMFDPLPLRAYRVGELPGVLCHAARSRCRLPTAAMRFITSRRTVRPVAHPDQVASVSMGSTRTSGADVLSIDPHTSARSTSRCT